MASGARGGDFVAIAGIGGLGHLAIQYGKKLGFKVAAISHGSEKEALSRELGAHLFINSKTTKASDELKKHGGAKVILCTAPSAELIADLVEGLSPGGHLIVVAFTPEMLEIPASLLLAGGRSVSGFVGGSVEEALKFSVITGVRPMTETFHLEDAPEAYDKMLKSKVHFRAVIKIP